MMATNVTSVPPALVSPLEFLNPLVQRLRKSEHILNFGNLPELGKVQSLHSLRKFKFFVALNKMSVKGIEEIKPSNRCMEQQVWLPLQRVKEARKWIFLFQLTVSAGLHVIISPSGLS